MSVQAQAHFGSKGPFGGTVSCATTFDTTVYIGTLTGGVYSSTSSKLVGWKPMPVGLKSGRITALAHTGTNLYAATADSGIFIFNGYVGTDRYWNKINTGLTDLNITCLLAINATTVMAGTTNGLFLTTTNGDSWVSINSGLTNVSVRGITNAGARIFIATGDGVYASDNNGISWFDFNDIHAAQKVSAGTLFYNAATDALMVVNGDGLYLISGAGSITTPTYIQAEASLPDNSSIRSISATDADWYLSTDMGVFTSSVSSIDWTSMNTGLTTLDVRVVLPFKSNLICGTYKAGIFKSANVFIGWSVINTNFNNLATYSMIADGVGLIAAATENGVYVSTDIAANYRLSNKGLIDSLHVNDLVFAKPFLLAATEYMGVYISADTGKNWTSASDGLSHLCVKKLFHAGGKFYVFDADGDIYNTDLSSNWALVQTGLPDAVKPSSIVSYGKNILLGTYGSGVYTRSVTGTSWVSCNAGLSNMHVTSVTTLGDKIYAGTDGSGVFISDSSKNAVHWYSTTPTVISFTTLLKLRGMNIQAMGVYAGYVWASYKGGLLASSDEGNTWIAGGTQFNLPSYSSNNKISFVTTRMFVITENNGLYSNALSEIPTVTTGIFSPASAGITALSLVPNPNKGSFRLNLSLAQSPVSEISMYDYAGNMKGRFTTAQEMYTVNYTQGMYIVVVKTEDGAVYTQKMIIE